MTITRTKDFSAFLSLQDSDYTSILTGVNHKPRAYVEIVDTDSSLTTLSTCTGFNITIDRDDLMGSFSCNIVKARDWNPRASDYADLFETDKRKRINIYFAQNVGGTFDYLKVFTGIMTSKPESYAFGGSDLIGLSGSSLAYLLLKREGTFSGANLYGPSKELLQYWLDDASIEYDLSYEDTVFFNDISVNYSNALAGVNAVRQVVGPNTDCFFDAQGRFIFQDLPQVAWSSDDVEFEYTESNIISIEKNIEPSKVTTVVDVTGNSDTATASAEASADDITKYGRNRKSISSGLVTSAAQAAVLAQDVLDEGQRWINPFSFVVKLNPYITIGSFLTVRDSALSNTSETQVRVRKINHSYQAGQGQSTSIEAYVEV